MNTMISSQSIIEFIEYNDIERDKFGNCHFEADVEFQSARGTYSFELFVRITRNGYADGTILLEDSDDTLMEAGLHQQFVPQYQKYEFDEPRSLSDLAIPW